MNKTIIVGMMLACLLIIPSVIAIDVGRPLLDTTIEYGNTYSYVQSFYPWQTPPNIPESLNGDDVKLLGFYIDGSLKYYGTRSTTRNDILYSYYRWSYDASVPSALRLTAPQISEVQFNKRADLNADGAVDASDKLLLQQFVNGEIDTFPCCSHLANQGINAMSWDERVGFIFSQMTVNPLITIAELILFFIINLLIILGITQIVFPRFNINIWETKPGKAYKKSGIVIEEIKAKIKSQGMQKLLLISFLTTVGVFFVQSFFLSSITSGFIGYAVSAVLTFALYATAAYFLLKIRLRDVTEFAVALTACNIVIWYCMNLV